MPARDGTGPMGEGPGTGRGLGPCAEETRVISRRRSGRGFGSGFGFRAGLGRGRKFSGPGVRRGLRQGFSEYPEFSESQEESSETQEQEKKALKNELKEIESEKQEIEKRLKELDSLDKSNK